MRITHIEQFGDVQSMVVKRAYEPVLLPGEALLGVHAVAINHHDRYVLDHGHKLGATTPYVGGIHIAGIVNITETHNDQEADEWAEGDRVVVNPIMVIDGDVRLFGAHLPGGLAQYIDVPQSNLCKIPDEVSFEAAAEAVAKWTEQYLRLPASKETLIALSERFNSDMQALWSSIRPIEANTVLDVQCAYTADGTALLRWEQGETSFSSGNFR